ncbi:alpha-L-fucosidase [Bacteroidota bacterium]
MNKIISVPLLSALLICSCTTNNPTPEIPSGTILPSGDQLAYQQMEMVGFIHFTVNTFTDQEWGTGAEYPSVFNPTKLDAEQWVETAKAAGMKELILTAKHHDGFCLWPSAYTEHSVKNSPYKNGNGDIVQEFTDACRKHKLKVGLYLSPWDRNHKDYGTEAYIAYYRNQLKELLTNYGEINEIWFDGANGGFGYYGGANEERRIDKRTYYDWVNTIALVKELQPDTKIFSDAGPDIRWVGNEHGYAGETFWSTISTDSLIIGGSDPGYLNTGDPDGNSWIIGQCDVSVRPGWFYHAMEDSLVKTPHQLVDIYYKSVGRNGVLLLNLPPDRRGLIHENDVAAVTAFKKILDETFYNNLALQNKVTLVSENTCDTRKSFWNLTDGNTETYWTACPESDTVSLVIDLALETVLDRILLQEAIQYGQRISRFSISIPDNNDWKTIARGTTIGYKRILRLPEVTTRKIRIDLEEYTSSPVLTEISIYKSSKGEKSPIDN